MTDRDRQFEKMKSANGFIAALDQSGGSTPGALAKYGVSEDAWSNDEEMFDRVHEMRTRIVTDSAFQGDRIVGAILFEDTMARDVEGRPTARYLWEVKDVVPFLKVDQGKEAERDGVELMKPMTKLDALLDRAEARGIFGTKMRSVINEANETGIRAIVEQQFREGRRIAERGFVPILEPEVNIHCPDKAEAEQVLHDLVMEHLDGVEEGREVMLKLTLPEVDNLYADCIAHPRVVRVVALSGGYSREEANERLAAQKGMIASFSRALAEGLHADQSDDDFHRTLDRSVQSIFEASIT